MRDRRNHWQTAATLTLATVLSALAVETNAEVADETREFVVYEHRTQPVPGSGPLTVQVWHDGNRIQVVALNERGAMLVLRSGSTGDGVSVHPAPMQGVLPARTRTVGADGTVTVEECARTDCAQTVALRASALAAKANFRETPVEHAVRKTQRTVVRMCPIDDDGGATIATNAEWAWAGAYTPCKWRVLPAGTLTDWPVAERSVRVRVGDTVFQMDRAVLRPVHGV